MEKVLSFYAVALLLAASSVTAELPGPGFKYCNRGTAGTNYCGKSVIVKTLRDPNTVSLVFVLTILQNLEDGIHTGKASMLSDAMSQSRANLYFSCSGLPASEGEFQYVKEVYATANNPQGNRNCVEDPNFKGTYLGQVFCAK